MPRLLRHVALGAGLLVTNAVLTYLIFSSVATVFDRDPEFNRQL